MAKTTDFQSSIQSIIASAAAHIASAVRSEMAQQLGKITAAHKAAPGRRGRPRTAAGKPAAAKGPRGKAARGKGTKGKFIRRSAAAIEADNNKILGFVKANPGLRSEQIQKGMGLGKPIVAAGLQALRDARKVSMKGVKRAATYTAV